MVTNEKYFEKLLTFRSKKEVEDYVGKDICDFYVNASDKDVAAKDKDVLNSLESDQCDLDSANETINSSEALFHSLKEKLRVAAITRDEKLAECDEVINSTEKKIVELQQLLNEAKQVLEIEKGTQEKAISAYTATERQVKDEKRNLETQVNHALEERSTLKVDMERKLIESAFIDYTRTDNVDKVYTYMSSDEVFEEEGLSDQRISTMTQDPDIVRQKRRLRRWGYHRNQKFVSTFGQGKMIPLSTRHGKIENVKVNGEQNYIAICFNRPLPNPYDEQMQPPATVSHLYLQYRELQASRNHLPPRSPRPLHNPTRVIGSSPLRPLGRHLPRSPLRSASPSSPMRPLGKAHGGASPLLSRAPMYPFGNDRDGVSPLQQSPIPSASAYGSAFSPGTGRNPPQGSSESYSKSGGENEVVKNLGSPEAIKNLEKTRPEQFAMIQKILNSPSRAPPSKISGNSFHSNNDEGTEDQDNQNDNTGETPCKKQKTSH